METRESTPLAEGRAALARGDWDAAKRAFESALQTEETAEALEGLGLAAWWLDRADIVFDARERAFRIYRDQRNDVAAARVAVWLAWDSSAFRGEQAIATGWLQRARRLLENQPPALEHAWLALRAGVFALLDDGNPEESERLADEAIKVAQKLNSTDYEVCGRSLRGFAVISAGRVTEGLRDLDEVSAAVLGGEVKDWLLMGLSGCYLIAACDRIRDYDRATQWCDRIKEETKKWGLRPLFAVCRTQYASVCMWRGAWDEAEKELSAATDELASVRPGMTGEGLARLGELRRRQGKLDEASAMFEKSAGHPVASLGRALLAFDRADFKSAADLAERHLRKLAIQNRTERAAALELLVRAHVEMGSLVDAGISLEELNDIAARAQTYPLRASASYAAGIVSAASGDPTAARKHLEDAVDLIQKSGAPMELARIRVELARVLGQLGRKESALEEANRAIEDLNALNAEVEIARARKVVDDIKAAVPAAATAVPATKEKPANLSGLTVRELEVLRLVSLGLSNNAIAEKLFISEHTVHRHVANTLTKLGVSSRSAAVAQVARLGLL